MKDPLLAFNDKGIYCAAADVYLDPWKPVAKALISHGHSDHSRWGHILGSFQIRVEYQGEIWLFSGDYKKEANSLDDLKDLLHSTQNRDE